jgi:hypothetical protein
MGSCSKWRMTVKTSISGTIVCRKPVFLLSVHLKISAELQHGFLHNVQNRPKIIGLREKMFLNTALHF